MTSGGKESGVWRWYLGAHQILAEQISARGFGGGSATEVGCPASSDSHVDTDLLSSLLSLALPGPSCTATFYTSLVCSSSTLSLNPLASLVLAFFALLVLTLDVVLRAPSLSGANTVGDVVDDQVVAAFGGTVSERWMFDSRMSLRVDDLDVIDASTYCQLPTPTRPSSSGFLDAP
ncbi:hypothetical protein NMY22_g16793 [Coprinellus aureogranulatus]|nr:hypothetical protein NMY22_g16793 [Coprinellus aureogranulatus]